MSMALRTLSRSGAVPALRGCSSSAVGARAGLAGLRHASSSSTTTSTTTREDPKSRANSLINALPGNSLVSKAGTIVLGTALTGAAISTELFVVNEEVVVLGSFAILIGFLSTLVRAPYSEWADGQIEKIKGILNESRSAHTKAVQGRIDSVGEMKDVVSITEQLFALSKETAQIEHETFLLRQKATLANEIKTTLDSWVRYEAQLRESEQQELVKSIQDKVLASLKDSKMQKDILGQAVSDLEALVKAGKI